MKRPTKHIFFHPDNYFFSSTRLDRNPSGPFFWITQFSSTFSGHNIETFNSLSTILGVLNEIKNYKFSNFEKKKLNTNFQSKSSLNPIKHNSHPKYPVYKTVFLNFQNFLSPLQNLSKPFKKFSQNFANPYSFPQKLFSNSHGWESLSGNRLPAQQARHRF